MASIPKGSVPQLLPARGTPLLRLNPFRIETPWHDCGKADQLCIPGFLKILNPG